MVKGVGVVTLTYGNRFNLISETISETLKLTAVEKMVVVLNGVDNSTLLKLEELAKTHSRLILHDLQFNSGSAKGFSEGIQRIRLENISFIWLIDDDNSPQKGALTNLLNSWAIYNPDNKPLFSLLSYRPDRLVYKHAIERGNPYHMLGAKNSFLGFHALKKIKQVLKKEQFTHKDIPAGVVAVAPYGGMFFKRELIDVIGLPDEKFFLYADDHDFSYRITKNGGKIVLIIASVLKDLETSFHLKNKKGLFNTRFFATDSKNAIFYSVRNNIYFERNFITNPLVYSFNKYLYLALISGLMLLKPKNIWKLKLVFKALRASSKIKE